MKRSAIILISIIIGYLGIYNYRESKINDITDKVEQTIS